MVNQEAGDGSLFLVVHPVDSVLAPRSVGAGPLSHRVVVLVAVPSAGNRRSRCFRTLACHPIFARTNFAGSTLHLGGAKRSVSAFRVIHQKTAKY